MTTENLPSGILFFTLLNSVGKETPVYLGENSRRKEGSLSSLLFYLSIHMDIDMSIHFNCFMVTRVVVFTVFKFDYSGVSSLQL